MKPGDIIKRVRLHDLYGGRRQGGISPSRASSNVFAITAPSGAQHGYIYDGRGEDGFFHYTGEGQLGDQQMTQGNRAIRDHEAEGRDLQLFEAHGTDLEYIGPFRHHDHYQADAPETGGGLIRKVIVFRLEQLEGTEGGPRRTRLDRFEGERIKEIPVEQQITERTLIEGNPEPREVERREQRLVRAFVDYLEADEHDVCRLQLRPDGESAPLFCDVFDKTTQTVYEAKGTVARPAIRMAIGQLADYSRLVEPTPQKAILVPERPRADLIDLADSQDITVAWPDGDKFESTAPIR